jgi:hypothetical protein
MCTNQLANLRTLPTMDTMHRIFMHPDRFDGSCDQKKRKRIPGSGNQCLLEVHLEKGSQDSVVCMRKKAELEGLKLTREGDTDWCARDIRTRHLQPDKQGSFPRTSPTSFALFLQAGCRIPVMYSAKAFHEKLSLFSARPENGGLSSQMQTTSQNMLSALDNGAVAVVAFSCWDRTSKSFELGSRDGSRALPRKSREVSTKWSGSLGRS